MSMDQEMSPERNAAYFKFRQAQTEAQKGHTDKAVALAHEGLHSDPTYAELRHWLAELYVKHNEPRKASPEYQELIHHNRADTAAWDALRRIDPAAADRLERLANMAPDPFVAKQNLKAGAAADDLLLEDVEGFGTGDEQFVSGGNPLLAGQTDHSDLEDIEQIEGEFAPIIGDMSQLSHEAGADMLAEMSEIADEEASSGHEPAPTGNEPVFTEAGFFAGGDEDALDTGENPAPVATQQPQATVAPAAASTTASAAPAEPAHHASNDGLSPSYTWEHEQDRPFRDKLLAYPAFAYMVERIEAAWEDEDEWDAVHHTCAHADPKQHPDIYSAALSAAARLALTKPELYIVPERFTQPEVFRGNPVQIAVPTGILRGFDSGEKTFVMGRWLGAVASGHLAYLQACHVVIGRKVRIEDCAMAVRDRLEAITRGWKDKIDKEELPRLKALCHAWEQRAVLSSDRAGLVCCQDAEAACHAIAKSTAKYADDAMKLSTEKFLAEFEGQDVGQLAAIPVEDGPCSSKPYAVYRIAMLRWWAGTPEGQALI